MAEVLPAFLSSAEISTLLAFSDAAGWKPGRQGTGYDILPLQLATEAGSLVARSLALLGTPYQQYWDVYLIRYLDGSHIPPHVDDAQHGKRHRRLNAVLRQAERGGELRVDGVTVPLAVGDAVRFYPDREVHEVTAVEGSRLLFSVGAWIEPE